MSLTSLVRDSFYDYRTFEFGSIWTLPDDTISIPDADRDGSRNYHQTRVVVVVSNNRTNTDPLTPVISIMPLSHRTDCLRYGDVLLSATNESVRVDSVLRVRLLQPALKADLVRCVGQLSTEACEDILASIEEFFGLIVDESN